VSALAEQAETLRALHHGGEPLVLLNAWDADSARTVEAAGFPAVATTSGGVAASLGYEDGERMPVDEAFAAVARIAAAVSVPVTADVESGYGLGAEELVSRLLGAGAVGCNLEDTDHSGAGGLVAPAAHAERVAAVKAAGRAAGVELVVNARVDVYLHGGGLDDALPRARLYKEAGADCVFPIFVAAEADIAALVDEAGAVNVYLRRSAPPLPRLAELGVARVTFGSAARKAAAAFLEGLAAAVRAGDVSPLLG
jgi:2-methylisocitrate lyase-like PEP mutase family enzyme